MTDSYSEARFTKPTDYCPHPEWWTSEDDESTENEVSILVGALVRATQPTFCIETGSAFGYTSAKIGEALHQNGHGWLMAIEMDETRADITRQVCDGLPVQVFHGLALNYIPEEPVDFCFFDSTFTDRIPEFTRYHPYMHHGTVVVFHDTAPSHGAGLFRGWDDLRETLRVELGGTVDFVHLETPRGVTIGVVR